MCMHVWVRTCESLASFLSVNGAEITWQCIDMCTNMCVDMRIDMRADMCTNMCVDVDLDMCVDMCIDMRLGMMDTFFASTRRL